MGWNCWIHLASSNFGRKRKVPKTLILRMEQMNQIIFDNLPENLVKLDQNPSILGALLHSIWEIPTFFYMNGIFRNSFSSMDNWSISSPKVSDITILLCTDGQKSRVVIISFSLQHPPFLMTTWVSLWQNLIYMVYVDGGKKITHTSRK
jgi:hypothetical protein